jgi:predicted RNA-binding Zn-ribbon protein involved in translation (DUF1610 family)
MQFYDYTCPDCGIVVRQDHETAERSERKVCDCADDPVETVEAD